MRVRFIPVLIILNLLCISAIVQASENSFGSATANSLSLKGDIYYLPTTTTSLPDFSSLTPIGSIYTSVLDIPTRSFTTGFPGVTDRFEWFAIRYTGTFNVDTEGNYAFRLVSDDGSRLFIDGKKIIDNDGLHATQSVSGNAYLTSGQHSIEVDYFQGPREEIALQLFWTPPGGSEEIANPQYTPSSPTPASPTPQTVVMHPTKEMLDHWVQLYNSEPEAPEAAAVTSPLKTMQYPSSSGTSFSLLNYLSYSPSDRSQGSCGNCWAWASTGIMEIALAHQNGIKDRLSVQYLDSNLQNQACCGGTIDDAAQFYTDSKEAISWANSDAQYQDTECSCGSSSIPTNSISTSQNYPIKSIQAQKIVTHGVGKETAIAKIKAVLRSGKAVFFSFRLPNGDDWNKFYDFWQTQPENAIWQADADCGSDYDYQSGGAHAVLCVGYDDTDPNNRYWIMLNSWGITPNRPDGLFLVSMDMNYDCQCGDYYSFWFQALDVKYDVPSPTSANLILRSGDARDVWKPVPYNPSNWGNPVGDPLAKWTWATPEVNDPAGGEVQTYEREFYIDGTSASGKLTITCDNGYQAFLNDVEVGTAGLNTADSPWDTPDKRKPVGDGASWETAQTYDVTNQLRQGQNILKIICVNYCWPGSKVTKDNPAGLLYRLEWS